jgi:hypothetical protein
MHSVEEFLVDTINVEQAAASRCAQLPGAMQACGNCDVSRLFRRLSEYSRPRLADARAIPPS